MLTIENSKETMDKVFWYQFAACRDGLWSPWTDSSTHRVDMEMMKFPTPRVTIGSNPMQIGNAQEIVVEKDEDEDITRYTLELFSPDGEKVTEKTLYIDEGCKWTIEEKYFDVPGTYKVKVYSSGLVNGSYYVKSDTAEYTFEVTGTRSAAPEVSVDIEENQTLYIGERATFSISADGADRTGYKYRRKYDNSTWYGYDYDNVQNLRNQFLLHLLQAV